MNREIQELRETITKLVPLLTGKGLAVTQRGSQAYVQTDPKTKKPVVVNIPSISDNATPEFCEAIQGYIDHEVAHVLITDWHYYAGGESDPKKIMTPAYQAFQNTHNIVEDTMIEREIVKIFPGSRRNIEKLRREFIKTISTPAIEARKGDPKDQFRYIIVPLMRALAGHEEFIEQMDKGKYWDNPYAKEVIAKLKPETLKALKSCSTTKETLEIAKELHAIIMPPAAPPAPPPAATPPAPKPPKPPKEKKGEGEDKPEKEAGEGDGDKERKHEEKKDEGDKGAGKPEPEDEEEDDAAGAADPADGGAADGEPDDDDAGDDAAEDDEPAAADPADGDEDDDADDAEPEDGEHPGSDAEPADEDENEDGDEEDTSAAPASGSAGDPEEVDGDDADDEGDDAASGAGSAGSAGADEGDADEAEGEGADGYGLALHDKHADQSAKGIGESDDDGTGGGGVGAGEDGLAKSMFDFDEDAFESVDMNSAIAIHISQEAMTTLADSEYNVFTRDFDRIEPMTVPEKLNDRWVPAMDDTITSMIGRMQKDIERLMASQSHIIRIPGQRRGKLHGPSLFRVLQGDERVFSQKEVHKSKDTAVTLLIDNSGSMRGSKMKTAMYAGYALSQTLERVKIAHEVIGFTTADWYGTPQALLDALEEEREKAAIHYHRTIPLAMPIYKSFDERIDATVKNRIAYAANAQRGLAGNIDGECLQYAAQRLGKRMEKRKVMIVLSDGMPAGDMAGPHLKWVVEDLTKHGIECIGIGIEDDSVRDYYPKHVVLHDVNSLPGQVMGELRQILQ